jgi:carboxypeptidase family protein
MPAARISPFLARLTFALAAALAIARSGYAQSAIAGTVTDTTGAVLPGVTVEARSPALIEQVRTAQTDAQGQYRIINLRPGVYSVTFTLEGFSTVVREGIELQADFTAPVSVELKLGAVQESVTVTGQSPVVDIQTTQRREVLPSALVDMLPTGRSYQSIMATLPAVSIGQFDVGGSSQMWQGQATAYGGQAGDFKINIDGLDTSISLSTGQHSGLYLNDGGFEEYVYQVNAGNADTQTGGIKLNIIPKQGGNRFSGQFITTHANEHTQSNNVTDDLRRRGLTTPPGLYKQYDYNGSLGGPVLRDRLWFFTSYRAWAFNYYIINVFNADGTPFHDTNRLRAYPLRLTTQINPKNKLTAVYERDPKFRQWRDIDNGLTEPKAAIGQPATLGYYGQVKWTSTLSNRTLVEAGYSTNFYDFRTPYQPEVKRPGPGDPWGDISKIELNNPANYRWNAASQDSDNPFASYYVEASLSYVTGTHAFKAGFQDRWGYNLAKRDSNGAMTQRYRNGRPDSVTIGNWPVVSQSNVIDIGVYGQDSWTMDRLTLNLGLRWDRFQGYLPAQDAPPGRWVPARHFDRVDNLPLWNDISPRIGVSYDLFGNAKTALKGSFGRYVQQEATSFQDRYNPMIVSTANANWVDLNNNDIAEGFPNCTYLAPGCEINWAQVPSTFGVRRNRNPDADLPRPYQLLYNVSLQHELRPGLAAGISYNRRGYRNIAWTDNLATTFADYSIINIADPRGNGTIIPIHSLDRAKLSLLDELDTVSDNRRTYNGVDISVNGRLPNGITFFGGTSTGRVRRVTCQVDNPNERRFCDQTQFDMPFITSFKLSGHYPAPYGVQIGGVYQRIPGNERTTTYLVNSGIAPGLTAAQVIVDLTTPGESYYDAVHQLDLSIGRTFRTHNIRITPKVDIFNALNVSTVTQEVTRFSPTLGRPTGVLFARLTRFGVTVDF